MHASVTALLTQLMDEGTQALEGKTFALSLRLVVGGTRTGTPFWSPKPVTTSLQQYPREDIEHFLETFLSCLELGVSWHLVSSG